MFYIIEIIILLVLKKNNNEFSIMCVLFSFRKSNLKFKNCPIGQGQRQNFFSLESEKKSKQIFWRSKHTNFFSKNKTNLLVNIA